MDFSICKIFLYILILPIIISNIFHVIFVVFITVKDFIIVENICYPFPLVPPLRNQFLVGLPMGVASAPLKSGLVMWNLSRNDISHI